MTPSITSQNRLAILAYHKIGSPSPGGWESWYYIKVNRFREQLQTALDEGWTFVSPEQVRNAFKQSIPLPEKALLITFDDGYRSNLIDAAPVLQDLKAPAIIFVPTDYIGKTNAFDNGCEPEEPICTWEELRQLNAAGISVQSHGVTHRIFSNLSKESKIEEAIQSKRVLEQGLQCTVDFFSYPFGDNGGGMDDILLAAGYTAAFLYKGGPAHWKTINRYQIPRVAMGPETDLCMELK